MLLVLALFCFIYRGEIRGNGGGLCWNEIRKCWEPDCVGYVGDIKQVFRVVQSMHVSVHALAYFEYWRVGVFLVLPWLIGRTVIFITISAVVGLWRFWTEHDPARQTPWAQASHLFWNGRTWDRGLFSNSLALLPSFMFVSLAFVTSPLLCFRNFHITQR